MERNLSYTWYKVLLVCTYGPRLGTGFHVNVLALSMGYCQQKVRKDYGEHYRISGISVEGTHEDFYAYIKTLTEEGPNNFG